MTMTTKTTKKTQDLGQNNKTTRPPIVVVMGHIDHGKSTLLDYIRETNICAEEAGGITQHMGAYQVNHVSQDGKSHSLTFLDTPGHEAFCSIRTRGAQAADIAILVVSAEDGVKPQTLDALTAIKSQNIPYIVAINKIDKPNANIDRTKTSLGEHEIYVEGWGGDIPCVAISALKGDGVPELLDMVILMSDMADLSTCACKMATGIVVESELDTRTGVHATLLIKDGTLEVGMYVVAGSAFAPVRFIENFLGKKINYATASMPIFIVGWNEVVPCGSTFQVVASKKEAEEISKEYSTNNKSCAKILHEENPDIAVLPIIIKADTNGSLEGVRHEIAKIKHDKVRIKVVGEGLGEINENDVKSAVSDPRILLIGFHVMPDSKAAATIERSPIPLSVLYFDIIYKLSEFIQEKLTALVPKEYIEEVTGRAKILALFSKEKDRQVVGGKVESGTLNSGNDVRIMRRNEEIGRGKIRELQSKKLRVSEVAEGFEFGTMIEAKIEIAVGDRVESVKTIEKK